MIMVYSILQRPVSLVTGVVRKPSALRHHDK